MHWVGLTGGIGSGKSTVAGLLQQCGAAVIDADAISRSLTTSGGQAIAGILAAFGPQFITAEGALDRDRMRQASFTDSAARKRLEAILHPLIGAESARQEVLAAASGTPCIVFDIPLLVESPRWRQKVAQVLVVDCPQDIQITRVMARSGLAKDAVERIIAAQASRVRRVGAADIVLFNAGDSIDALALEVRQVAQRFGLSLAAPGIPA